LIGKVNFLKEQGLSGVGVAAHWLSQRVQSLKKHVHPGWGYCGLQDPTCESRENISRDLLVKHLREIFQEISGWRVDEQVRSYHIGVERDPIRCPIRSYLFPFS
jgi:hypothetical protein